MLAWIDLEATSLDVAAAAVLEVAAIVTDDRLAEVGRFHRVVYWWGSEWLADLTPDSSDEAIAAGARATGIDRAVVEMHAKNGLWAESAKSPHDLVPVDNDLAKFLAQTSRGEDVSTAQIAGSSIWFDRSLMAAGLPRALRQLHYRSVDVTTLHELARRFWPGLHGEAPRKREIHRSVPDVEDSLALCRYYVGRIDEGGRSP